MPKGARTSRREHSKFARGDVWPGYINITLCDEMAATITAAQHYLWRHVYACMQAAQTPASKLRFIKPDKESSINTLWQEEEFK